MKWKWTEERESRKEATLSEFNTFIEKCIIKNESMLVNNDGEVFTVDNIGKSFAVVNGIVGENTKRAEDKKDTNDLWKEVEKKYKNIPQEQRIIIQHALWFVDFAIENRDFTNKDYAKDFVKKHKRNTGIGIARQCFSGEVRGAVELKVLNNWKKWKEWGVGSSEDFKKKFIETYGKVNDEELHPSLRNIILYLCNPEKYEPIISDFDKDKIVRVLYPMFVDGKKPSGVDRESAIHTIKDNMSGYCPKAHFSFFYEPTIVNLWNDDNSIEKNGLTVAQQLEYKKAMILYGPPGTGKTHDVDVLIDRIVTKFYLDGIRKRNENAKQDLKAFLSENKHKDDHVLRLQMHVNYTYEDFVIGQVFINNTTSVKPGALLQFIGKVEEANNKKESKEPYFVVLDEINRVDILRVFGEVFSAIEYRGKPITLSIQQDEAGDATESKTICIPDNLYFIGTMNEIDFSLEHIDFALRRRFVWVRKGFDKEALGDIITSKIEDIDDKNIVEKINENLDIEAYKNVCESLNKRITAEKSLGENYEIGHTFFAEIVPIYEKLLKNDGNAELGQAKQILWQISIKPTLEAYCGGMSAEVRQNFIGEDAKDCLIPADKLSETDYKKTCIYRFLQKERSPKKNNTNGDSESEINSDESANPQN